MLHLDAPPLNPEEDTARRWLRDELSKREYTERTPLPQRILEWLKEHLGGLHVGGVSIPWYVVAAVIVGLALLGLVFSLRRYRPTRRTASATSTSGAAIFDAAAQMPAAAHRREAEHLIDEDPRAALIAAYRALVARAHERGLVRVTESMTVGDVDAQLSRVMPSHGESIRAAGARFAAVRYGGRPAVPHEVRIVLDLDDAVASAPATGPSTQSPPNPQGEATRPQRPTPDSGARGAGA